MNTRLPPRPSIADIMDESLDYLSEEDCDAIQAEMSKHLDILEKNARKNIESIARVPILRHYIRQLGFAGDPAAEARAFQNTQAWHAEGERWHAVLQLTSCGLPAPEGYTPLLGTVEHRIPEKYPGQAAWMAVGAAAMLRFEGQVYLWKVAMEALADAADLPPHVIDRQLLPFPYMFWSRDVARGDKQDPHGENNWLFLAHAPLGLRVIGDCVRYEDGQVVPYIQMVDIPYGNRWPDDIHPSVQDGVGRILKRISFLNSKYVDPTPERLPRTFRRPTKDDRKQETRRPEPLIRVVKLRREAQEVVDQYHDDQRTGRKYTGRWWVSGHHRAQWYPSRNAHEVIWIQPYLKGTGDVLPGRVYAVER